MKKTKINPRVVTHIPASKLNQTTTTRKKSQRKLALGIWNVQGWRTKDKEVIAEFESMKLDIMIMTETKKKGNGTEKMGEIIHCWSGIDKKERAKAGIAIILKKKWEPAIENWEPINERIAKLNLKVYERQIILLAVYGPTENSSIAEKE
ncbi:uncharacterized protein [Diabrotica undecimpunctata]|uniref:uncharacterized protein n=1 Tax=Diabrotica undecimpunctata TaxID=50387 RepID=UPI003B632146